MSGSGTGEKVRDRATDDPQEIPWISDIFRILKKNPKIKNIYFELGSTFAQLSGSNPERCCHMLGQMIQTAWADHILWGTDSIWYGPTQQLVDAFRVFQIPVEMQEEFGYPALTSSIKDKILSRNAARVYGIDVDEARRNAENDDLAWVKEAFAHHRRHGSPQ